MIHIVDKTSECLENPNMSQNTSKPAGNLRTPIFDENGSEHLITPQNVEECLRTFQNNIEQLRIHEKASEHPRTSVNASEYLETFQKNRNS